MRNKSSVAGISLLLASGLLFNTPLLQYMLRPNGIQLTMVFVVYVTICQVFLLSAGIIMLLRRAVLDATRVKKWIVALVCLVLAGAALEVLFRSIPFYRYAISDGKPGWSGRPFLSDSVYGLINAPLATAWELIPGCPPNPVRFDSSGFRVSEDAAAQHPANHPDVLFLGCSFTFGSGVIAEEAFPGVVGLQTGCSVANAGVCSWGAAQMLRRAEELVPSMRPAFLVFQYSPWLISRTRSGFAPVYFGVLPTPYYSLDESGHVTLCEPPFMSDAIALELDSLSGQEASFGGFMAFLWSVALPLYMHDDYNLLRFRLREIFGYSPVRLDDSDLIVRHVYGSISRLCRRNGVQLIVLRIANADADPFWSIVLSATGSDALIADGETALWNELSSKTVTSYRQHYWTWSGDPPRVVNAHPNAIAHSVLADCIIETAGFETIHATAADSVLKNELSD